MPHRKGLESAEQVTFCPGGRCGIPGIWVSYPIDRVMSRRQYGVSSDGDKLIGLAIKCKMERRRRAVEVERDAWHYNATIAELDVVKYQKAYTHLAAHQQGIGVCSPDHRGILVGEVREGVGADGQTSHVPPAPTAGVLFDI